jgi:peptidoglycan/LPS O-acetylase OafA/YrhL
VAGRGVHLPVLDGVRGIAILLVLCHHFSTLGRPWTVPLDGVVAKLQQTMWSGVDLFFVLSGFLITGILYDSKASPNYFRAFYARRVLRIFPLYYAFLAALVLLLPLLPFAPPLGEVMPGQVWYWTYLANLKFAWDGALPPATGHLWSLAIEEQFYLLWPLVVLAAGRRALMRLCVGIAAGSLLLRVGMLAAGSSWATVYALTPARLDALVLGGWVALAARGPDGLASLRRYCMPVAGTALAVLCAIAAARRGLASQDPVVQSVGFTMFALLFAAMLVLAVTAAPTDRMHRWMSSRMLRSFGRLSYAMYLVHYPIPYLLQRAGFPAQSMPRVYGWQLPGQLAYFALLTGATFGIAYASWHLFEKHFLKLKDAFPYEAPRGGVERARDPVAIESVTAP